jgi:hypothetical protein
MEAAAVSRRIATTGEPGPADPASTQNSAI